jgi:hypothetical protein
MEGRGGGGPAVSVTRRHGGGRGARWGRAPVREMRGGEPVRGL